MYLKSVLLACFCMLGSYTLAISPNTNIFTNSFHMDSEFLNLRTNSTIFIEEYQAEITYYQSRTFMAITAEGNRYNYMYIPESGHSYSYQVYPVKTHCITQPLNQSIAFLSDKIPWHWLDHRGHWDDVGPSSMLKYVIKHASLRYSGSQPVIGGVKCNLFTGKVNDVIVSYYETVHSSNTPDSGYKSSQPVRLVLQKTFQAGGWIKEEEKVHHQYTFLPIKILLDSDEHVFELPAGFGCATIGKTVGKNHDVGYSFYGEIEILKDENDIVGEGAEVIDNIVMTYSRENNFFATIFNKFKGTGKNVTVSNKIIKTNLLQYGYQYTRSSEGCKVENLPLDGVAFDLSDGTRLKWSHPKDVFDFSKASYLGETYRRGVAVSMFEKTVLNYGGNPSSSAPNAPMAIITLYETASTVRIEGRSDDETFAPVAMDIRIFSDRLKFKLKKLVVINFSWFETVDVNKLTLYKAGHYFLCSDSYDSDTRIQITYEGNVTALKKSGKEVDLETEVDKAVLTTALDLLPMFISNADILMNAQGFRASFSIRSRPSAILDYYHAESNKVISSSSPHLKIQRLVLYEEDCAEKCTTFDGAPCTFYSYCEFNCYIYSGKSTPDTTSYATSDTCVTRKRTSNSLPPNSVMPFTSTLVPRLSSQTQEVLKFAGAGQGVPNPLAIDINLDDGKDIKFTPMSLTTALPDNDDLNTGSILGPNLRYRTSNYKLKDKAKTSKAFNYRMRRGYNCYQFCKQEGEFYCESFSYCPRTQHCVISSLESKDITNSTTDKQPGCFIYTRSHLDEYVETDGIILQTTDGVTKKASSEDLCAEYCSEETYLAGCESFDYCSDSNSCVLHKTHNLDIKSISVVKHAAECDHYSKDYRLDYYSNNKKSIPAKYVSEKMANVSAEECARFCSKSKNCSAYDYCEINDVSICQFSVKSPSFLAKILDVKPSCVHFDLINVKKTPTPPPPKASKQGSKNTISSGAAAGVAIVMIFVGGLIAVGALYIYHRRRIYRY